MLRTRSRRRFAALASGLLVTGAVSLGPPVAQAAPVFTDAETILDAAAGGISQVYAGANDCTTTPTGGAEQDMPVVENGPVATASASSSASFANTSIPGDTAIGTADATGTGRVTSSGGNPSTLDLSMSANAQLANALGTSTECRRRMSASIKLDFQFVVAQAGFLTVTSQNAGSGVYGEVYVQRASNPMETTVYVDNYGYGLSFNTTTKVYLPAGTYNGYFEGEASQFAISSFAVSGRSSVHAQFHVAGSQTEAITGKGKKYVTLPGARSCAAHSLAPSITGKKKRAGQIKQVTFFVNGTKVKKVKTPDKGDVVTLPVADDQTADVVAEVKLLPRKKGKPSKVLTVGAGYEACS